MSETVITIEAAIHGGFVVWSGHRDSRPRSLLFAGLLGDCLDFARVALRPEPAQPQEKAG